MGTILTQDGARSARPERALGALLVCSESAQQCTVQGKGGRKAMYFFYTKWSTSTRNRYLCVRLFPKGSLQGFWDQHHMLTAGERDHLTESVLNCTQPRPP